MAAARAAPARPLARPPADLLSASPQVAAACGSDPSTRRWCPTSTPVSSAPARPAGDPRGRTASDNFLFACVGPAVRGETPAQGCPAGVPAPGEAPVAAAGRIGGGGAQPHLATWPGGSGVPGSARAAPGPGRGGRAGELVSCERLGLGRPRTRFSPAEGCPACPFLVLPAPGLLSGPDSPPVLRSPKTS